MNATYADICKDAGYRFVAKFKRIHTSGTMAGLTTSDSIHFASMKCAQEWKSGVDKYAKRNGYTVIDMVVLENV